jgi:zinc/manganese transport system permease protein
VSEVALDLSILAPALLAGALVLATHVPMGRVVLARGIIFIDLAVAQVAGLGVIAADRFDLELGGFGIQIAAGLAAIAAALLLTWTERAFQEIQEAVIGVLFILAATGGILMLADNPHGGEELQDLLLGQILWVSLEGLWPTALLYAGVLALWFGPARDRVRQGVGFYLVFAVTVTASVQLVGVYLVFASLIVPAVATRELAGRRAQAVAMALGIAGYAVGLAASMLADLPTGAAVVWSLAAVGGLWMLSQRSAQQAGPGE